MQDNLYNLAFERSILSSIVFEPQQFDDLSVALKKEDFYLPAHQDIFSSMLNLLQKDQPIDEEFLKKELIKIKKFDEQVMLEILSANPISNTKAYVDEIKDKSLKRHLLTLTTEIKRVTVEEELPSAEVIDIVEKKLYEITQDNQTSDFKDSPQMTRETMEYINEMKARGDTVLVGVDTGFHELNKMTTGFGKGDLVIIAARPAMGKCLGKGTKVLMYDATLKNVEDIKVGDQLMGDDSTPRTVLSLARGREKMYWVRQNKGIDYRVNESHILSLKRSRNEGKHKHGEVLNIEVRDYNKKSKKFHSNYKGYKVAVDFKKQKLDIEPYFLGLWLGDGHSSSVNITTTDKEVINYLNLYAKKLGLQVTKQVAKDRCPVYGITSGERGISKHKDISLQKKLRALGVLNDKHIPHRYLQNSKTNRLELLAGILDSDGYYDEKFNVFEIVQKDEKLTREIKFLADSLGFRVSLKIKQATIKEINYSCDVYRLRIVGDLDKIPTKIKRKKARKLVAKRDFKHTGIKVEYDKIDDYYGFTIDKNHLFLLEDMTVTHNTSFILNTVNSLIMKSKGVAFFSLEMPAEQLMLRLLSIQTSIPLQKLRVGDITPDQDKSLMSAIANMDSAKLFVDDQGSININQLRSKLRKLKNQHPEIEIAVIDYLQIMQGVGNQDRHLQVSEISRGLKMLARELNMPIVALSQLNRGLEARNDKRPMLSDIRESGSIEQDADIILFVYRDDVYLYKEEKEREKAAKADGKEFISEYVEKEEEDAEIIIGKQRNGPTGHVKLVFQKKLTRFVDVQPKAIITTYEHIDTKSANVDFGENSSIEMPTL
ncbi:MAG: replicative DNA helicase [Sulfurimonas sp.]|uniref:replicative DNA helicase n=1 Tax=Sulfurimonas sp. TaxID=2022749 RepID=UPI0025E60253|nr:replicative DNA helicase [Sulfurimonas sp.]MCK9491299.1 replicative DNA helicase [Sulfurimonas sp.]